MGSLERGFEFMIKSAFVFAVALLLVSAPRILRAEGESFSVKPIRSPAQEKENFPYIEGEVLVKFREDPQMRPSSHWEQVFLGRPKIKTNKASLNRINERFAVEEAEKLLPTGKPVYRLRITAERSVEQAISEFEAEDTVEFAEPNFRVKALGAPNDPDYQYQWNFRKAKSEEAWDIAGGGSSQVKVAVLDTGVAYEDYTDPNPARCAGPSGYYDCIDPGVAYARAPDFSQANFALGYDFVNDDSHPNDDCGHGTHVAATIVESTNNAQAAAGLAFNISLMPVKVLAAAGGGAVSTIIEGINFAQDNGAKVINLSLGTSYDSQAFHDAISGARSAGVIVVAASGNGSQRDQKEEVLYPAAYSEAIAVGAVRFDKIRADYSNYGEALALVAPGGQMVDDAGSWFLDQNGDTLPDGILQQTINPGSPTSPSFNPTIITSVGEPDPSTDLRCTSCDDFWCRIMEESCGLFQGTSMATPHVAAAAALILSQDPSLSPSEVQNILENSAEDLGPVGWDEEYGHGFLDLEAALNSVSPETPILSVKVSFERIWGQATSVGNVKVKVGSSEFIGNFSRADGGFSRTVTLEGISPGIYSVVVKGPLHLSRKVANLEISSGLNPELDLTGKVLWGGDLNTVDASHDKIDMADVGVLLTNYDTTSPEADINFDGEVDMQDVGFLINNYGKMGEE